MRIPPTTQKPRFYVASSMKEAFSSWDGCPVVYENSAIRGLTGKGHVINTPPDEDDAEGVMLFWFGQMWQVGHMENYQLAAATLAPGILPGPGYGVMAGVRFVLSLDLNIRAGRDRALNWLAETWIERPLKDNETVTLVHDVMGWGVQVFEWSPDAVSVILRNERCYASTGEQEAAISKLVDPVLALRELCIWKAGKPYDWDGRP